LSLIVLRADVKMSNKISIVLVGGILIAVVIGAMTGYFVRANEQSTLMADLEKAKESKSMLEQELKAVVVAIPFKTQTGQMAHDVWLLIAPLQNGKYALAIRAQGLEQNGAYIVEVVTKAGQMQTVPIAASAADSEFLPDQHGNGLYWVVLDSDPRVTFERVLLLFLPDMQMQNAVLVATADL